MKYTTTSLIKELEKFPEDLVIETELAMMWNYDDKYKEYMKSMSPELFKEFTQSVAIDLCIFEGSWEKGNVSDVDGIFKKFQKIVEE